MGYGIGSVLALIVSVFARLVGLDRDRAFYPTVLIVIALIYVLFAVMGGSMHALMMESIPTTAFIICSCYRVQGQSMDCRSGARGPRHF